jgi:hypothetical protein
MLARTIAGNNIRAIVHRRHAAFVMTKAMLAKPFTGINLASRRHHRSAL